MLACINPDLTFSYANTGNYGRCSDSQIFGESALPQRLPDLLPPAGRLPNLGTPMNYHLLGDQGFGISTQLITPYSEAALARSPSRAERVKMTEYNERLSWLVEFMHCYLINVENRKLLCHIFIVHSFYSSE